MTAPRKGRRPGAVDTRGEVLAAARTEFATKGYAGTTVRGIAREAGVDPALVHHYFGGKDGVFAAAMDSTAEQRVDLERRVPVFLTYLTAWVDEDGTVQFRRDVYRQDPPLVAALARTRQAARAETPAVCRRPDRTPV